MVATAISVNHVVRAGITAVTGAASDVTNHNSVVNNGATWLEITNTGGASGTVTVKVNETVDGISVPGRVYTVAAAGVVYAGPFPPSIYGGVLDLLPSAATMHIVPYTLR